MTMQKIDIGINFPKMAMRWKGKKTKVNQVSGWWSSSDRKKLKKAP